MTNLPYTEPLFLRREDAAEYVSNTFGFPVSRAWLARLAVQGGGPVFRKAGRVPLYTRQDLETWAQARLSAPFRASGILATSEGQD